MAAGTLSDVTRTLMQKFVTSERFTWVSNSSGAVNGNKFYLAPCILLSAKFIPGAGALAPSANYDAKLLDPDGNDVLGGQGADLTATEPDQLQWDPPIPCIGGQMELQITNAGDSKSGTIEVVYRRHR